MDVSFKRKQKHKRNLSDWIIDYDQKTYSNLKVKNGSKDILIYSFNECSNLRRSFHDSLRNIFAGFDLWHKNNSHKNNKSLTIDFPNNGKNTKYYCDEEISVIKKVYNLNYNKNQKQIKPQNKVAITSIRKKIFQKDFDDDRNEHPQKKKYKLQIDRKMSYKDNERTIERQIESEDRVDYDNALKGKEAYAKEAIVNEDENTEKKLYLKKVNEFGKNLYPEKTKGKILNSIFTEILKVKGSNDEQNNEIEEIEEIEKKEQEINYQKSYKTNKFKLKAKNEKPKYENEKVSIKNSNLNRIKFHNMSKNGEIYRNKKYFYKSEIQKNSDEDGDSEYQKKYSNGSRIYNRRLDLYNQYLKEKEEKNKENIKKSENKEEDINIKSVKFRRELNKNKITNEIIYRKKIDHYKKKEENKNNINEDYNDKEGEHNYSHNIYKQDNRILYSEQNSNKKKEMFENIENEKKKNIDLLNIKKEKPVNVKQNFNFDIKIDFNLITLL